METVTTSSASELIRVAGLRVTAPRQAVLEVLRASSGHPDVEEITAAARTRIGRVSHQTVYDVLAAFERADLVRCIDPTGSAAARYEFQRHDNHHHLVCRSCREIVDVPCSGDDVPCMHPPESHGFAVELAEVVYWGQCARCRDAHEDPSRSATVSL